MKSKNSTKKRNRRTRSDEFRIEKLLPAHSVSLIAGPTELGRTRWVMQILEAWRSRAGELGHNSNPAPFVYISTNRPEICLKRTLKRLGINPEVFPFMSLRKEKDTNTVINKARKRFPKAEWFFIDSLDYLVPGYKIESFGVVRDFLVDLSWTCERKKITVIGVVRSTSTRWASDRERVRGSVAWASLSATIILLEPKTPHESKTMDQVVLLPRHAPKEVFKMKLCEEFPLGL